MSDTAPLLEASTPVTPTTTSSKRPYIALLIIIALFAAVIAFKTQVGAFLGDVVVWIQDLGPLGPVFMIVLYIATTVAFVPGSLLTLASGYLWGVGIAYITVAVGSTLGATAAFLAGKWCFSDWISGLTSDNKKFQAVNKAIEAEGGRIIFLVRLSPVLPFNLLNYALSLTPVNVPTYMMASLLGMAPGTLLYCWIGASIGTLQEIISGDYTPPPSATAFFVLGLIATILVFIYVARIGRAAIDKAIKQYGDGE